MHVEPRRAHGEDALGSLDSDDDAKLQNARAVDFGGGEMQTL
jgi:hypothetical protein